MAATSSATPVSVTLPPASRRRADAKAGWTLAVRRGRTAPNPTTATAAPSPTTSVEITWKAASREAWLADAHYDEFTLRGQLPATPQALWFKVRQLCELGELHWADVPASGTSTRGLKAPAVLLEVTPAEAKGHVH